jgi:hypothetical protein
VSDFSQSNAQVTKRTVLFWLCIVFIGLIISLLFHSNLVLGDPDLWWHIVTGQAIIDSGQVPRTDTYSYTFTGQPWIAKEWLSQVLLALSYNVAGWNGVIIVAAIAASASFALLYYELARHFAPTISLVIVVLIAVTLIPITIARPHVFTFVLMVLWTSRLFRSADAQKPPEFWLLPVVTLWTNLHGSFTLSFVIAAFAFLYLVEKNRLKDLGLILKWIGFGLLCPVAALINPYGIDPLLVNKTLISGIDAMKAITEWQPLNGQDDVFFEGALLLTLGLIWLAAPRVAITKILFILFTLHMMLTHVRFVYVFFMLVPLAIAAEITKQRSIISMQHFLQQPRDKLEKSISANLKPIITSLAIVTAGLVAAAANYSPFAPPSDRNIGGAFAYIKEHKLAGHVFNDYNLGGPLISIGVKTYIDGRADQLFQGEFFKDYIATTKAGSEKTIDKILRTSNVTWTIFPPESFINTYLATQASWKKTYGDKETVIFEKQIP